MIEASFDPKKTNAASVAGAVQYDTGQRLRLHGLPTPEELAEKDDFLSGDTVAVEVQFAYEGDANTEARLAQYDEQDGCWMVSVPDVYLRKNYPVGFFVYVGYGATEDSQRTKTMYTGAFTPKGRPAPNADVTPDQLNAWDALVQEVNLAISDANRAASNANAAATSASDKAEQAAQNAAAAQTSAEAAQASALAAEESASAVLSGSLKVFTHTDFSTTSLMEILNAIEPESIFYGNSDRYYGVSGNNLPLQYGLITIYSLNAYRKVMILNGVYGNTDGTGLVINGRMYIANIQSDSAALAWTQVNSKLYPPTPADVGAIPTVAGAREGCLPVFDSNGNLADSGAALSAFTRAKMTLSGTTLTITTVN